MGICPNHDFNLRQPPFSRWKNQAISTTTAIAGMTISRRNATMLTAMRERGRPVLQAWVRGIYSRSLGHDERRSKIAGRPRPRAANGRPAGRSIAGAAVRRGRYNSWRRVRTQRSRTRVAQIHAPTSTGTAINARKAWAIKAPPIAQTSAARKIRGQRAPNAKFKGFRSPQHTAISRTGRARLSADQGSETSFAHSV
jgi:hypothetical protein